MSVRSYYILSHMLLVVLHFGLMPSLLRAQNGFGSNAPSWSDDYSRGPMPVSGAPVQSSTRLPQRVAQFDPAYSNPGSFIPPSTTTSPSPGNVPPPAFGPPSFSQPFPAQPGYSPAPVPPNGYGAPNYGSPNYNAPAYGSPAGNSGYFQRSTLETDAPFGRQPLSPYAQGDFNAEPVDADLVVGLTPSRRSLNYGVGVGFNSDLGLFGQFVYDDRDFDWRAAPWMNPPVPWRGGGQRLLIEAMPGAEAQRYLVSFTEPYFGQFAGQPVALNLSGFYFDRDYFDWDETRFGGRIGLSTNLTRELQLSAKLRIENVDLSNPRVPVMELQRALGDSELYGAGVTLAYDTRDDPYSPTSGAFFSAGFEQVFGTFEYPRGTVSLKKYAWFRQRADTSGRHVLGLHFDGGITGEDTPIYENFFAGGFSTLRGFRFRHASPKDSDVIIGGELSLLGSAEYFFPVTADDMVRGVLFSDFGTVEETTSIDGDNFRLSVGGGLRVTVPALGPAPLAIDIATPLMRAPMDRIQNIAFFVRFGR